MWLALTVALGIVLERAGPGEPTAVTYAEPGTHSPTLVGEFGGQVHGAVVEDDRLYVAVHSRLVVLDARDRSEGIREEGAPLGVSAPLGFPINGLDVRDGIVVTTGKDLVVLDARDPTAIREIGRHPIRVYDPNPLWIDSVAWVDDVAWFGGRSAGLHRIDLSDPTQPRSLGPWLPLARFRSETGPVDTFG